MCQRKYTREDCVNSVTKYRCPKFWKQQKSSIFRFDSNLEGDVVNEHRMYTYYNIELIGYGHFSDWHLKQRFFTFLQDLRC